MSIRIITDSGSDIIPADAQKMGITVLPLKVLFGEEEYLDTVTITHDEFFTKMIETGVLPTTSQVSPYDYENCYEEAKKAGDTVIVITISAKLSGCYQSALIAAQEYEDMVYVIDSTNVCVGQRILVDYALRLVQQNLSVAEIVETLNQKKKDIRTVALLDTLEYLKKGGRISSAVALAGTLLSIKPVIEVKNGEVVLLGQARGSKAANNKLSELISQYGGINFDMPYYLAYSGLSDALLKKYIADSSHLYPPTIGELPYTSIGGAIGTHAGPGAIAASFFVNK